MSDVKDNVIRLYDVRPEMALEHMKRSSGVEYQELPHAADVRASTALYSDNLDEFPILTDIVDLAYTGKA